MSSAQLTWSDRPEKFTGDIGATVALSHSDWEKRNAQFSEIDDGDGETARIAAGTVETSSGDVEFGVLDYFADSTYLLAPAAGAENQKLTAEIVEALIRMEVLSPEDVMDERSPFADDEVSLAQRVAVLEQWAGETVADVPTTAVPVAVEVEIPLRYPRVAPSESLLTEAVVVGRHSRSTKRVKRHVGTIKSFDLDKGFGVIAPEGGGEVVIKEIVTTVGTPAIGKKVTFRYALEAEGPDEESSDVGVSYSDLPPEKA